ncbi:hypothetical protein RI367_008781, partial [Sorochytrium milnesiophthora]
MTLQAERVLMFSVKRAVGLSLDVHDGALYHPDVQQFKKSEDSIVEQALTEVVIVHNTDPDNKANIVALVCNQSLQTVLA